MVEEGKEADAGGEETGEEETEAEKEVAWMVLEGKGEEGEKKGGRHTRLVGRHANYKIGVAAAKRWLEHMEGAIRDHENLGGEENDVARAYLVDYFRYPAYYIVVASEYMRDDQLSGGTQVDGGRVW